LVDRIEVGFSNAKHRQQWRNTLTTYCKQIWALPIDGVDTKGVLECLTPIWTSKPETASRLRGRIERVLNAAKAERLRSGDNPAAWRGHLDATLPKAGKLIRGHHAALPYMDIENFMASLREREGIAPRALEFLILTATRTGETLGAQWIEFDFDSGVWAISAERMKARVEHRVPLSCRALEIVAEMKITGISGFVFPGQRKNRPLSNMALMMTLRRMRRLDITAHGFRSTFSDWASEVSSYSAELRETALAHTVENKAEKASGKAGAVHTVVATPLRSDGASWKTWRLGAVT
jgi:integrase